MRSRQLPEEDAFEGMIGGSIRMQEVFASIRKVATTDAQGGHRLAAFAGDENRGIGGGDLTDRGEDLLHANAAADHPFKRVLLGQLAAPQLA